MKIAGFLFIAPLWLFITSGVVSFGAEDPKKAPPPPQKATAAQLIVDAERALGLIGKAVKDSTDKSIDLKSVKQQPFWSALKKTDEALENIQSQLSEHDPAFFDALNASTQAVAELKSALPRSGIKNAKVDQGVKALSNALTVLRRNYGIVALRKKKGGDISDQERAEFTELKEAEKQLVTKLEALVEAVQSNPHLTAELTRLIAQLKKSIVSPFSVDEYYAALELVDVVEGEWNAYAFHVDTKNRKAWQDSKVNESLKTVSTVDKKSERDLPELDWDDLDESTDIPPAYNVTVEIEADDVEGYLYFIEESVDGIEVSVYYEESPQEEDPDESHEEFPEEQQQ